MFKPSHLVGATLSCVLACGLSAQGGFIYSPALVATQGGSSNNTIPFGASGSFGTMARYQQVHGGLQGKALVLSEIAFRRGVRSTPWTGTANTAGVLDVSLHLAHSDHSKMTTTFASNYLSKLTMVKKRGKVNIPNTQPVPKGQAPWNINFPFDTVYPYTGKQDLLWEMLLYAVMSQSYFIEAHSFGQPGTNTNYGTGCVATGQTRNMLQQMFVTVQPWSNDVNVFTRVFYGPVNANAGIGLGAQRTNTPVGNWCTNVYTNPLIFWFGKTTTANGVFVGLNNTKFKWNPAFANATFFTQGFATDSKQGIVLTQGAQTTVPAISSAKDVASRLFTINGSTTTPTGLISNGYGATIRLAHK